MYSEEKQREIYNQDIKDKIEIERTVSIISSRFVGVKDIDMAIDDSIMDIGRISGASRVYVFMIADDGETMTNTHEWCDEGVIPEIENLVDLPTTIFPWWMAKLHHEGSIYIEDISKLPEEASSEKDILEAQGIEALLVIALHNGEKISGFIGIDNVEEIGKWKDENLSLLKLVSEIIGKSFESKKIERALQEKNRELNETLELLKQTEAQLINQEKLAGIGQLAAGVAHEINNPLGFILSNSETLREYYEAYHEVMSAYRAFKGEVLEKGDQEDIVSSLRAIDELEQNMGLDFIEEDVVGIFDDNKEGLNRVGEIIKGLRSFSRIDQSDKMADYDLNEGIKTTLIVANNELKYCSKIEMNLQNMPVIKAQGGQINQVLLNLFINAAHAIKAQKLDERGTIKVKTFADGEHVFCEIEDDGTGIKEEHLNLIFNPFFTTKEVGEGTGLGLGLAYDIVINKHSGNIDVESQWGHGTKFTIKLPIDQKIEEDL